MSIRELSPGQDVELVLLVRDAETRRTKSGGAYLRLQLADRTGVLAAVAWDATPELSGAARPGAAVHVTGRFGVHERYGAQLTVHALRAAREGEYDLDELLDGPPRSAAQMEADLRELLTTLAGRYGTSFRRAVFSGDSLNGEIIILVNGRNVLYLQGLDTALGADDEISIFPMVAGG